MSLSIPCTHRTVDEDGVVLKAKDFQMDIGDYIRLLSFCNRGSSRYELQGDTIQIERVVQTLKGCPESDAESYWFITIARTFIIDPQPSGFIVNSRDGLYWLTFQTLK